MAFGVRCKKCGSQETEHTTDGACCDDDTGMPLDSNTVWTPERRLTEEEREELRTDGISPTH